MRAQALGLDHRVAVFIDVEVRCIMSISLQESGEWIPSDFGMSKVMTG